MPSYNNRLSQVIALHQRSGSDGLVRGKEARAIKEQRRKDGKLQTAIFRTPPTQKDLHLRREAIREHNRQVNKNNRKTYK